MSRARRSLAFWRLSGLRQAVLLTGVFLCLLILSGFLAVGEFHRQFDNRVEDELRQRFLAISAAIEADGFDPERYPNTDMERVFVLEEGQSLRPGFHENLRLERERERRGFGPEAWAYLAGPRGQDQLVIGTNLGRRDQFLEIILQTLSFIGLGAAILALIFGLILGLRTQRRLNRIGAVLEAAGTGDLGARTGVVRRRDDLDALAGKLDGTLEQLDVLMRQSRDFSANIAHDLKTPLARLRIRLEKALVAELDSGDSADQIGAALEQTDCVIAIFDAFLRIAKLESGAAKARFEPLDLGQIAREVAETYESVVEDGGRQLRLEVKAPWQVEGDRVLLMQMLANLIENAIRHTPEGTRMVLVAKEGLLGLADTGPGIPAEEYARVTQPLYRLEKSRSSEGAGLGLSLVQTIAALHKAELMFSANPDLGEGGLFVRVVFGEAV